MISTLRWLLAFLSLALLLLDALVKKQGNLLLGISILDFISDSFSVSYIFIQSCRLVLFM